MNKYGTKNPVLIEARMNHDPCDQFAWVQEWRFAIAQWLTDASYEVEDFRGSDDIREDYAYEAITSVRPTISELRYALKVLDRYREWLRIAGEDY